MKRPRSSRSRSTRSRSDRRASRRIRVATILLRLGLDVVWTAFVTRTPVALVDMIADELQPTTATATAAGAATVPRGRRLADTAVLLLAIACLAACVVAVVDDSLVLSLAAAAAATVTIAYRPIRVRAPYRSRLPIRDHPANPPGIGRD